jgi:hypothetical protein
MKISGNFLPTPETLPNFISTTTYGEMVKKTSQTTGPLKDHFTGYSIPLTGTVA